MKLLHEFKKERIIQDWEKSLYKLNFNISNNFTPTLETLNEQYIRLNETFRNYTNTYSTITLNGIFDTTNTYWNDYLRDRPTREPVRVPVIIPLRITDI